MTVEKCAHSEVRIAVCEYGICENEDPDYNDPHHCKHDTRMHRNIPSSKELISLATTEFKNREERKGLHDRSSWVSGWISGFLTERKPEWGKEAVKKALNQLECDIEMSISKHPERVVNGAFREDLFNAIQSLKGDVS